MPWSSLAYCMHAHTYTNIYLWCMCKWFIYIYTLISINLHINTLGSEYTWPNRNAMCHTRFKSSGNYPKFENICCKTYVLFILLPVSTNTVKEN